MGDVECESRPRIKKVVIFPTGRIEFITAATPCFSLTDQGDHHDQLQPEGGQHRL